MLTINELETILYSSDDFKYYHKSDLKLRIITETHYFILHLDQSKMRYWRRDIDTKIIFANFDNYNIKLEDIKNITETDFGSIKDKMDILCGLNRKLKIEKLLC